MVDWIATLAKAAKAAALAAPKPGVAHPRANIINPMGSTLPAVFDAFHIDTPLRQAHFVAQCCVESAYFQTLTEYASGEAYEGRHDLGNIKRGDGPRFKGRGPIQVTGRANYTAFNGRLAALLPSAAPDIVAHPEKLADPVWGTWAAGIWWDKNKANLVADKDKTGSAVSRLVNRGSAKSAHAANAEAERMAAFKIALAILTLDKGPSV